MLAFFSQDLSAPGEALLRGLRTVVVRPFQIIEILKSSLESFGAHLILLHRDAQHSREFVLGAFACAMFRHCHIF